LKRNKTLTNELWVKIRNQEKNYQSRNIKNQEDQYAVYEGEERKEKKKKEKKRKTDW
jgi:hypothetical protein